MHACKSKPEVVGHLSQFFSVLYIEAWSVVQLASLFYGFSCYCFQEDS